MLLPMVVILAMIATVAVLVLGVHSMAHGGTYDLHHSGQLMSARVGLQLLAFALVMLALFFAA